GFEERVAVVELDGEPLSGDESRPEPETASVYRALVLGVRDYCRKCGFEGAVLGLSGGVDSALCAAVAADALGPANVLGVTMPSRYSSAGSVTDSAALAANLGIEFLELPIRTVYGAYLRTLKPVFSSRTPGVTEENIQARVRGNLLMALSNRTGRIVLATGNKSELAVGYCTLYGDMAGGLAVLADVPKTMVYELARFVNRERELIPASTIEKPPSAELRPGQRDSDSLPPYDLLDAVLERYVEQGLAPASIVAEGFDRAVVERVVGLVDRNEFKRRQAAPGLRVTSRAFGMGRRMPVAARFRPASPPGRGQA
ncbi:NAD(+) synthase, partial [candidate division WOR-3 bacterium]|nr:NAD(+) synthase [candidate division WOR-3 bacterium]